MVWLSGITSGSAVEAEKSMADGKEKAVPCKRGVYITYRNRDMRSNILLHLQALRDRRLQRQFMVGAFSLGLQA